MDRPFGRYGISGRGGPGGNLYFGADLCAQQFSGICGSKCGYFFVDGISWDAGVSFCFCDFAYLFLLEDGRVICFGTKRKVCESLPTKRVKFR